MLFDNVERFVCNRISAEIFYTFATTMISLVHFFGINKQIQDRFQVGDTYCK